MNPNQLYKDAFNFEHKVQQLETCDDTLSVTDWGALETKLKKAHIRNKLKKAF